jgi:hypothetical protein
MGTYQVETNPSVQIMETSGKIHDPSVQNMETSSKIHERWER